MYPKLVSQLYLNHAMAFIHARVNQTFQIYILKSCVIFAIYSYLIWINISNFFATYLVFMFCIFFTSNI